MQDNDFEMQAAAAPPAELGPPGAVSEEADGFQHLAPQYVTLERRTGYVVSLCVGCLVLSVTIPLMLVDWGVVWVVPLILLGWLVLGGSLVWFSHFWPPIEHRHVRWRMNETGLEIHRGVLWRHRIAVPLARVQHVDVGQGPLQRLFDLGTLTLHTAGTQFASIELEGLQHSVALQLRDRLIEQKDSLDVT